jgi:hypothetical protein
MIKRSFIAGLAGLSMLGTAPVAAQGIGHKWFMRGSIVAIDATGPVVCIGKADGAKVGQILKVYRNVAVPGVPSYKGAGGPVYRREAAGQVKIDHVFDDHFAHVTVTDGTPEKNDIVELVRSH